MNLKSAAIAASLAIQTLLLSPVADAQHLWWNLEGEKNAVCLYGEITVLATNPGIYYCGANWHPGEPAGGYCGIQHLGGNKHWTIFSVWDTNDQLKTDVAEVNPPTVSRRFGGEGTGGHTHMDWPWKVGEVFQFFVTKQPGGAPDTTDAKYYVFDRAAGRWLYSATIRSPNGGHRCVTTFGGGLNSFLENFTGREREAPKLALYRLWLGETVDKMKCLTRAGGDGMWGQLGDAYFLAEGDKAKVTSVLADVQEKYGQPVFGGEKKLEPISDRPLPEPLVDALKKVPK